MTSASDDDDYDDEVHPFYDDYEEHTQYVATRDRLPEFPGRIPPRKKRDTINSQPRKSRVSTHYNCFLTNFLRYKFVVQIAIVNPLR